VSSNKTQRFGILIQHTFSLMTGETRENPIQPLRQQPGIVQIGSLTVRARFVDLEANANTERDNWNALKQQQRAHECAAEAMGMMCGHAS
jgi:hypothetical protein